MSRPQDRWPDFAEAVRARLEKGQVEYADRSFRRPPEELLGEIEEELADVCGWAFVLWVRLQALGERLERQRYPRQGSSERRACRRTI